MIARLVRRGVVTLADLQEAGVPEGAIRYRLRRKRLHHAFTGVYFVGHPDPAQHAVECAAQKFAGPAATLSDETAGVLWHLLPAQVDPTIHLSLSEKRASPTGIKFHTRNLPPTETTTIHGDLKVTTPARTLLDLAHLPNIEQLVADAIRRKLTTREQLTLLLNAHPGERNTRRLAAVLQAGPLWSASEFERRFIDLLRKAELPLPESNLLTGRTRPDLVWRDKRLLVELDSRWAHADWIAQRTDRAKDRKRTLQGWTPLRYVPEDVRDRPFAVVAEIATALAIA